MTTNVSSTRVPWRDEEIDELRGQVAYWRQNYEILRKVIAAQHSDPALAWLDEIVHDRFALLLSERKL